MVTRNHFMLNCLIGTHSHYSQPVAASLHPKEMRIKGRLPWRYRTEKGRVHLAEAPAQLVYRSERDSCRSVPPPHMKPRILPLPGGLFHAALTLVYSASSSNSFFWWVPPKGNVRTSTRKVEVAEVTMVISYQH